MEFVVSKDGKSGHIEGYEKYNFTLCDEKNDGAKNVIYIYVSSKSVERLKGKSNILYIGHAEKTIGEEYQKEGEVCCYFTDKNEEVISFEQDLLVKYADEHLELPPLNNRF